MQQPSSMTTVTAKWYDNCNSHVVWQLWHASGITTVTAKWSGNSDRQVVWQLWRPSGLTTVTGKWYDNCDGQVVWQLWQKSGMTTVTLKWYSNSERQAIVTAKWPDNSDIQVVWQMFQSCGMTTVTLQWYDNCDRQAVWHLWQTSGMTTATLKWYNCNNAADIKVHEGRTYRMAWNVIPLWQWWTWVSNKVVTNDMNDRWQQIHLQIMLRSWRCMAYMNRSLGTPSQGFTQSLALSPHLEHPGSPRRRLRATKPTPSCRSIFPTFVAD